MIDPKTFISNPAFGGDDEFVKITGNFFCEKCSQRSSEARLNLDSKTIFWKCSCGENEASL